LVNGEGFPPGARARWGKALGRGAAGPSTNVVVCPYHQVVVVGRREGVALGQRCPAS